MNLKTIYTKTGKGMLEMKNKDLPKDISRILTLIDGKSSVGNLLSKDDKLTEVKLREMLKKLETEGFIRIFSTGPETMFSGDLDFTKDNKGVVVSEIKADVYNEAKARQQAQSQPPSRPGLTQPPPRPGLTQPPPRPGLTQPSIHDLARAEAEARAKKEAEEKIRKEAEARTKAEADARAKKETEVKAKAESETRLRAEAEARLRAEAEARVRTEVEAKAKREAEARLRAEAEARVRAELEAKAKREAEARLRAEAEARVRAEAEAKAKRDAEARAKAEAEARAKAEAKVKEEAAAKIRREAEAKAKAEVEARVKIEAQTRARKETAEKAQAEERRKKEETALSALFEEEAIAKIEAEASAKAEMKLEEEGDTIMRIQAEKRLQAEIEAQLKAGEVEQIKAKEEGEEKFRREARAKAEEETWAKAEAEIRASIKETSKKEVKEKPEWMEEAEKEEEKRKIKERDDFEAKERTKAEEKARAEAEASRAAKAKGKAEEEAKERAEAKRTKAGKKPFNRKPAAIGVAVLFAAALSLHQFIPFNAYIPAIEKLAAETLHEPVTINSLHITLLPSPQVKLEGFTIGKLKDIKIETVRVSGLDLVLGGSTTLDNVELDTTALEQDALARIASWGKTAGSAPALQIGRVNFRNVRLALKNIPLAPLQGEISLSKDGTFQKASLRTSDGKISAQVIGKGQQYEVTISVKSWQSPIGPELMFDYLDAQGVATRDGMQLNNIDAKLYGGSAKGAAAIKWDNGWGLSGDFDAKELELRPVIVIFARNFIASGTLDSKGHYTMQAQTPEKLFEAPRVESSFSINKGSLNNMDLTRALQAPSKDGVRGGKTLFAEFSGNLLYGSGGYQFKNMRLVSGPLSATGSAEISPDNQLAGRINVELKSGATFIKNSFTVSGNLNGLVLRTN